MQSVIKCCCEPFRSHLAALPERVRCAAREVRIRAGQPLRVRGPYDAIPGGDRPFCPTTAQLMQLLDGFCGHSPYAYEAQMAQGYLTLPGGHRVGLCGRAVLREGKIARLAEIQAMNIRIARQVSIGEEAADFLFDGRRAKSTLVISPPGMGKTTLLRQVAKRFGDSGLQVALVDERGELAAMHGGQPQLGIGACTDVLEGCPKTEAIPLLLRSMAPDVLITDEIGGAADLYMLMEAARCGVCVLASAHAKSLEELWRRPQLRVLKECGVFERYVLLGITPGHVLGVYDREGKLCRCD